MYVGEVFLTTPVGILKKKRYKMIVKDLGEER